MTTFALLIKSQEKLKNRKIAQKFSKNTKKSQNFCYFCLFLTQNAFAIDF